MTTDDRIIPAEQEPDQPMILSAERAQVYLPVRAFNRVRLVKYVETETVTTSVEVRRERLRIEEWPIDNANADGTGHSGEAVSTVDGYGWQPQDFELILHEEQVEVTTKVVAVERVQVRTRIVTAETTVSADLRSEQVDLTSEPVRNLE